MIFMAEREGNEKGRSEHFFIPQLQERGFCGRKREAVWVRKMKGNNNFAAGMFMGWASPKPGPLWPGLDIKIRSD